MNTIKYYISENQTPTCYMSVFNVPSGSDNEISKDKIYNLVDKFLFALKSNKNPSSYELDLKPGGSHAFHLMSEMKLISLRNPSNKIASIIDITPKGLDVLEAGGIKNYLDKQDEKEKLKDELQKKEFEKIKLEIDDLVSKVSDYADTKDRTIRNEYLVIASIGLALITLLNQLLCNRPS